MDNVCTTPGNKLVSFVNSKPHTYVIKWGWQLNDSMRLEPSLINITFYALPQFVSYICVGVKQTPGLIHRFYILQLQCMRNCPHSSLGELFSYLHVWKIFTMYSNANTNLFPCLQMQVCGNAPPPIPHLKVGHDLWCIRFLWCSGVNCMQL